MLVLTRETGERIVIGRDMYVTVVEARGDRARLGFDVPDGVSVHREEVFEKIQANPEASTLKVEDTRDVLLGACHVALACIERTELNMCNYNDEDVKKLNDAAIVVWAVLQGALAKVGESQA